MKNALILLVVLIGISESSYSQQRSISGFVKDFETKEPLIGVTVTIKNTSIGTTTKSDGRYTIQVSEGQTLIFSYVGMVPNEVKIDKKTPDVLNVLLKSSDVMVDEVVVVGYGVTKRRDLAGAISSLKPDEIEAGVISNMSQLLKGRVAGIQVRQNSLEPGGSVSVRIRGASSISADNEPLYVIDGFQTDNMTHINPDDIESIEILKDASTTAIYGARGANGVVLITTKKGKENLFNIEYSYSGSIKMMYNPWELLDAGETIALTRRLYEEDPTATSCKWTAEQAKYRGKGTDWIKETTRNATTNLHQLSILGGSNNLTAFVSANYITEPGILLNTNYERFGGRTNVNYVINNVIRTGASINLARSEKKFLDMGTISSDKNIIYRIFNLEPWKNKEGYDVFGIKDRRPGVFEEIKGAQLYQKYNTLYASVFAEVDLRPGLTLCGQYTYGYDHMKVQKYYDRSTSIGQSYGGQAFVSHEEMNKHQLEGILTWHQKMGEIHDIKIIGGTSYIIQKGEGNEVQAYGFASDTFSFKNIGAAKYLDWIGSGESTIKKASFFSRLEYVFNDKYIVNASLRADGSSVFGANHRWGYFPSASLAWHIGDEPFMSFTKPLFSRIKLRTSYGLSGNDGIRFGLSQYQYSVRDVYIGGNDAYKGMYPSNPYNPQLKWETTAQWNVGLDFMLLNGRIEASIDFYIKRTKDLLNPDIIHPSGGFPNYKADNNRRYEYTAMMVNDGKIENRGLEYFMKTTNIHTKNFLWSSSFNMSANRSRVLQLDRGQSRFQYIRPHGSYDEKEYIILQKGKPLSAIYGYVFDGIIQQGETYSPQPNSVAGDPKFKDLNGDGIIDGTDRKMLGHGTPSVILGLSNTFSYKDFDFSFFLEASLGAKMLNLTRIYLEDNNRLKDSEQRWTQGGRIITDENPYTTKGYPSNSVPRKGYQRSSEIQYGSYVNSRFVENANFLKLRNIELGYSFPLKKHAEISNYIKTARVFVGAQNLFTCTGYKGFDPDISTNGSSAIAQGLDLNSYPAYRTFNFGVKVTF